MNKYLMTLGIGIAFAFGLYAQDSILIKTQKSWYNESFEDTGIYGINTEKAYQFLKEHGRKPTGLIVGVLDGGIQADHIDLKDNMWVNPKEKPGNGKDDDKNGYIDDINGWNFIGGKDGKDVNGDTLEKVRIYKYDYLPMFESEDSAKNEENKTKFPEKYEDYQNIKAEISTKISEAKQLKTQYTMMKQMIDKGF